MDVDDDHIISHTSICYLNVNNHERNMYITPKRSPMIMLSLIMQCLMRLANKPEIICLITMMCWQRKIGTSTSALTAERHSGPLGPQQHSTSSFAIF
jgi:hypothetical protein